MAKRDLRKLYSAFKARTAKHQARSFTLNEVKQLLEMADEQEAGELERIYFGLAAGYEAGINAERNRRKNARKK